MSTQTVFLTAGATSKTIDVFLVQKAAATSPGDPITGLAYNTSSFTCYYRKGATGSATAITLATQSVGGAWSSGGFVEVSSANTPGLYRFDIPDTVIATTGEASVTFAGAANLATHSVKFVITTPDLYAALATPTNITAGTITTVTNLTNAPTAGDLTATMKTSVTTAATASTPTVTAGTVSDKTGYRLSSTGVGDILTTALTESYAADGAAGTLSQILFALQSFLQERAVSGTTVTCKKLDGSTTSMTFTLNDATTPTSITRAS